MSLKRMPLSFEDMIDEIRKIADGKCTCVEEGYHADTCRSCRCASELNWIFEEIRQFCKLERIGVVVNDSVKERK